MLSLNHWKQFDFSICRKRYVVICFQISIFEPLETSDYALIADFQLVTKKIRNIKRGMFPTKNLALLRDFLF